MNSPTTTGATAITGAMLAGVIIWVFGLVRVTPPPIEVAGTIAAMILAGGHSVALWINRRWPAVPPAPPPVVAAPPVAPPSPQAAP